MTTAFPFDQVTCTTAPTDNAPIDPIANPASTDFGQLDSTELAEVSQVQLPEANSQIENPKPLSEKRLTANRANAQKSTGPRTLQGKIASAQNALKHGLRSKIYFENQPKTLHLCPEESNHPTESGETYAIFQQEFKEELQPRTILQKSLFPQIVTLAWRLRRLPHTEQEIFARLAANEAESAPQPESTQQSLAVSRTNTLENPNSDISNSEFQISNPKSQIPSPQSAISNPQSPIPSSNSSFILPNSSFSPLPPPCQTLADIFCTATPNNPFTLFNRYERSLQNAYLRLLRQYHYLKKHHPTTPVDHSRPLPP